MRAGFADFAAAIFSALVRIVAWLSPVTADRTALRLEARWSITRDNRTPHTLAQARMRPSLSSFRDRTFAPESPGPIVAAHHETRNSHQRDPARDACRDHRGRPASRTAG